ncbi:MAG TPA: ABC transporter permease [Gemmataceae bacterium]|nr:ABC transporter permease [Gemmataceae bacterium]
MHHPLSQLVLARLREFYREPSALFWVYAFPLLLATGLGIAFWNRKPEPPHVDVVPRPGAERAAGQIVTELGGAGMAVEEHDEAEARARRRTGKTLLYVLVNPDGGRRYVYDEANADAVSARYQVDSELLRRDKGLPPNAKLDEPVTEPGNRYIDFLMPGLIGLNLMGGGLWGVGFVIVDMRVRKLLKRLLATPMRRSHYLLAVLLAQLVRLLPEMTLLVAFGCLIFTVPLRGSLATLALVILAGASAFAGIGLLVASRAEKTETVSGLMNLVMLPMWLLSGTFFSSKRFPDAVQPIIQALPLTQLNDALREVMLEGAPLPAVAWRLGILLAYAAAGFALALKWFRWQ